MKKRLLTLLLLAFFIPMLFPSVSHACKCVEPQSVEREVAQSKAVFSGKIIDIKNEKNVRKVLFNVEESWKGVSETQIILVDELSSCSFDFFEKESYLVYAYENPQGNLTTNICDLTKELSIAQEDLKILGKGSVPTEKVDLESQMSSPFTRYIYIWLPLLVAVALGVNFIRNR